MAERTYNGNEITQFSGHPVKTVPQESAYDAGERAFNAVVGDAYGKKGNVMDVEKENPEPGVE